MKHKVILKLSSIFFFFFQEEETGSHLRLSGLLALGNSGPELVVLVHYLEMCPMYQSDLHQHITSFFPASVKPDSIPAGHVLKDLDKWHHPMESGGQVKMGLKIGVYRINHAEDTQWQN